MNDFGATQPSVRGEVEAHEFWAAGLEENGGFPGQRFLDWLREEPELALRIMAEEGFMALNWSDPDAKQHGEAEIYQTGWQISSERWQQLIEEFKAGSVAASDLIERFPDLSTESVAAMHESGAVWSKEIEGTLWFPEWQFDDVGVRPDLPLIRESIEHYTTDALAVDRVMRKRREQLDGMNVIEAMGSDRYDDALFVLRAAGDAH